MRTGTARTEYEWVSGDTRATVRVESFVSRADGRTRRHPAGADPGAGRDAIRVRFALAGRAAAAPTGPGAHRARRPGLASAPTSGIRGT